MAEKRIKNELTADYKLVGIASSLREYKLCHHLNLLLGCDFRKLKNLIFETTERTRDVQFSVFKAGNDDEQVNFIVFANKSFGEVLLPEVNNFDFILQINGIYENEDIASLIEGIKGFPEVVMTAEIPVKKIKSKERLVYEEEKPAIHLKTSKRILP